MTGIQPPSSSRARSARPPPSSTSAAAAASPGIQRTTITTSNNSATNNNATANNTPRSGAASPVPLESVVIDYNDKSTAIKSPRNNNTSNSSGNVVKSTNVQVCVRIRPLLSSDFKHNINDTNNINNIGDATPRKSSKGFARETTSSSHRKTPATTTKKSGLATPTASGLRRPTSIAKKSTPSPSNNTEQLQKQQQSIQAIPSWQTHSQDSKRITQSQHTITSTTHHNPERLADYTFDRVYNENETTNILYEESIKGVVESVVGGYHGSVFAYGQTNSGKTHTMTGSKSESGVVRLAVQDIFNRITSQSSSSSTNNREYLVRVSYLEIYNEQIYDLLALPQPSSPSKFKTSLQHHHLPPSTSVRIFESRTEGVVVRGLREEIVTCPQDVYDLLDCGDAKRKVGSTGMNKTSSRSHSVFRLVLESRESKSKSSSGGGPPNLIPSSGSSINSDTDSVATGRSSITQSLGTAVKGPVRISSLSLVDLAGSESVKATNNTGVRQKEGQYINKSLLTLGHVVHKLSEMSKNANKEGGIMAPKEHIPYRDSKLTRLLQPSLGGNAQVCIICNISPALSNLEESHNTLKFAMRAKKIQQHARITEVADEKTLLRSYREEIEELKRQLKEAKQSAAEVQQIHHRTPRSSSSGGGLLTDDRSSSSDEDDQDDTHVLVSAIANLESLILKAGAKSTIRKSINDGGSTVGSTVEGDESLPSRVLDATLMKAESNESKFSGVSSPLAMQGQQAEAEDVHDDQVIQELHRIQGMLGSVMSKKRRGKVAGGKLGNSRSPERDAEVERLKLELQSQEAASTMRKADSSFLQSQLNEKEEILKEVSVLLEALEKRQLELESENKLLKEDLKGAAGMIEEGDNARLSLEQQLAEKNSSMEKRLAELESENKQLKDDLAQATHRTEEGDNTRRSLEEQLAEKENLFAKKNEVESENQKLKDDLAKATKSIEEGDKKRISLEQQLVEKDRKLAEKDVQKELHITQAVSHTPIKTDLPSNKDIGTQLSPDTPRFNQFVEEHFTKPIEGEQDHATENSPEKKIPYPSSVYTSPGNNETPKKYK